MLAPIPAGFEPTRAALHGYARAAATVARAHAQPHPKWWHAALQVSGRSWYTDEMVNEGGRALRLRFDLDRHVLVLDGDGEEAAALPLDGGDSATAFGDKLIGAVAGHGLSAGYERNRYENDEPNDYDRSVAGSFADILHTASQVIATHMAGLEGETGRVNLWPHGFDLAAEWYGTRTERVVEHGEEQAYPSQINFGFYPGGEAYFYCNPWPFESDVLLATELPHDAHWHTEGWQGSMYPYALLADRPDAEQKLAEWAAAVHEIAAPTLMAG